MKILKTLIIFLLLCTTHTYATNFKVDRSRSKMDDARNVTTKLDKTAFENMLLESQNQDNDTMSQLADKIVLGAKSQIKGIDIHGHALNKKLRYADSFIKNISWGTEYAQILKAYKISDATFIAFIKDVIHAEKEITNILADINLFVESNPGVLQTHTTRLKKTIDTLTNVQNNLLAVMEIINNIFEKELLDELCNEI